MGLTKRSQIALYTVVFLSCISFSIVMPTLWPYIHSLNGTPTYLAVIVAGYSVGEAVGALLFGKIASRVPTKNAMVLAMICGVLGSLLYVYPSRATILMGRFIHGIWTGASQAVQQVYLAQVLPFSDLTPAVVTLNAFASMGFVFGPAFGFLTSSFVSTHTPQTGINPAILAPGYAVLAAAIACVLLYMFVFDEEADRMSNLTNVSEGADDIPSPQHGEKHLVVLQESLLSDNESRPLLSGKLSTMDPQPYSVIALLFCNMAFFVHFYGFALQETVTTPIVQNLFNWSVRDANALFTFAGFLSLIAFILLQVYSRKCDDRLFLMISFISGAVGYTVISLTRTSHMFIIGFSALSVAFPIGRATCVALYTKLLPKSMQHDGQGILLAVGAIARIVGPFPAALAVHPRKLPVQTTLVFASAAMAFVLCAAFQFSAVGGGRRLDTTFRTASLTIGESV